MHACLRPHPVKKHGRCKEKSQAKEGERLLNNQHRLSTNRYTSQSSSDLRRDPTHFLPNPNDLLNHSPAPYSPTNRHRVTCFGTFFRRAECFSGTVQHIVSTKQTAIVPTKVQTENPNSQPKPLFTQNRKYTKPRLSPYSSQQSPSSSVLSTSRRMPHHANCSSTRRPAKTPLLKSSTAHITLKPSLLARLFEHCFCAIEHMSLAFEPSSLHCQRFFHAQSVRRRLNSTYYCTGNSTDYTTASKKAQ
jgi:hypothetical protein